MTALLWFRFYVEVLDDPKVQRLAPELFKFWINLLCLAARSEGRLPPVADIAFALRIDLETASTRLQELVAVKLLDEDAGSLQPHGWERRQYPSDSSTRRVQKHRAIKRNVSENVSGNEGGNVAVTGQRERKNSLQGSSSKRGRGRGREEAPAPRVWILKSDRRAMQIEERFKREINPCGIDWKLGQGGLGWWAPAEWLREAAA